jgi:gliding motility-associated-like protein
MTEKDNIKDLFAKGLQDHQVQVDPALWTSISSSIGTGVAKPGLGLLAKTLIGVAATAIVGGTVYLSFESKSQEVKKQVVKTPQETSKSKEDKKITPLQPIKTSIQQAASNTLEPTLLPADVNVENVAFQDQQRQSTPEQTQSLPTTYLPSTSIPHAIPVNTTSSAHTASNTVPAVANAVKPLSQITKPQVRISLPNIFTPNGDGQNETLQIDWGNAAIQDFSIVVLDANNNVVFKSDRPEFNWDGTDLGGEKLPRAHYIYFVSALLDGQKWQQSSSLQIQY